MEIFQEPFFASLAIDVERAAVGSLGWAMAELLGDRSACGAAFRVRAAVGVPGAAMWPCFSVDVLPGQGLNPSAGVEGREGLQVQSRRLSDR
jgi:hypothetical protein